MGKNFEPLTVEELEQFKSGNMPARAQERIDEYLIGVGKMPFEEVGPVHYRRLMYKKMTAVLKHYRRLEIAIYAPWEKGKDGKPDLDRFMADVGPRPSPAHILRLRPLWGDCMPGTLVWTGPDDNERVNPEVVVIEFGGERGRLNDFADYVDKKLFFQLVDGDYRRLFRAQEAFDMALNNDGREIMCEMERRHLKAMSLFAPTSNKLYPLMHVKWCGRYPQLDDLKPYFSHVTYQKMISDLTAPQEAFERCLNGRGLLVLQAYLEHSAKDSPVVAESKFLVRNARYAFVSHGRESIAKNEEVEPEPVVAVRPPRERLTTPIIEAPIAEAPKRTRERF
jgi:hypothetical protein